jgi:hypothetical protein
MLIHSAVITGSVQFNNTDVSGITNVSGFATTASVDALVVKTGSFATTSSVNELQSKTGSYTSTSSFGAYSSSINTFTSSATTRLNTIESVTGSFASTSSVNNLQSVTGSYASTGSNQFNGNQSISGSITSNGTITAQTLVVQTVTSSVEFITGSTRNGTLSTNTHEFTGSVSITGSAAALLNVNNGVLYVSASGNVGIGTTSPTATLAIAASNNYPFMHWNNSSNTTIAFAGYHGGSGGGNDFRIGTQGANDFTLHSNNVERMRLTSAGDVVIGTTTALLTAASRGNLTINGATSSILTLGIAGSYSGYLFSDSSKVELSSATQPMTFVTNGSERMRITSAGNVGISTTSPASKLTVVGDISATTSFILNRNGSDSLYGAFYQQDTLATTINATNIQMGSSGGLQFWTYSSSTWNERMRITSAGNVGIGTSSPSATLHVNGGLRLQNGATNLNYYEEGTWTPIIGGEGGQSGQSYSGQTGYYTKIGRIVTVTFRVVLTNKGTITGNAAIKGLPFTADTSGVSHGGGVTYFEGLATSWSSIFLMVTGGQTYATIDGITRSATLTTRATTSDIGNSTQFNGSFTYFV